MGRRGGPRANAENSLRARAGPRYGKRRRELASGPPTFIPARVSARLPSGIAPLAPSDNPAECSPAGRPRARRPTGFSSGAAGGDRSPLGRKSATPPRGAAGPALRVLLSRLPAGAARAAPSGSGGRIVNWKLLLTMPAAALLLGQALSVPLWKETLPASAGSGCDYAWSRRAYLRAFAYAGENRPAALRLARAAEHELQSCQGDISLLRGRLKALREKLSP